MWFWVLLAIGWVTGSVGFVFLWSALKRKQRERQELLRLYYSSLNAMPPGAGALKHPERRDLKPRSDAIRKGRVER